MPMYKSISKSVALISSLLMILALQASAQAPDYEQSDCSEASLDYWLNNFSACDPDNPTNISGGIISNIDNPDLPGNYPFGLCYPSFNNYTDATYDDGTGKDPYRSIPPLFKDERDFFKVRINDSNPTFTDYKNTITVKEDDSLKFLVYIHNDGNPCFNEDIGVDIPNGKFYSDWLTTSHDTRLRIDPSFFDVGGDLRKSLTGSDSLEASIWGSNVINQNGIKGGKTKDSITINTLNGENLILEIIPNSATYVDLDYNWASDEHDVSNTDEKNLLTSDSGMPLTTLTNGNIKSDGGDYYGSQPYIGLVYFNAKVIKKEIAVCKTILVDHPEKALETYLSWFRAQALDTEDFKYDSQITYSVDDQPAPSTQPYGLFYQFDPGTYPLNPPPQIIETSCSPNPAPLDNPDFINKTLGNVFNVVQKTAQNQDLKINNFGLNDVLNSSPIPIVDLDVFNQNFFTAFGSTSVTVDQCEKVYFYAFADSDPDEVIHAQAQSAPADTCKKDYPIFPVEEAAVCKNTFVTNYLFGPRDPAVPIQCGTVNAFRGRSVDTLQNTFTYPVRYTVNPAVGCVSNSLVGAQVGLWPLCRVTLTAQPGEAVWIKTWNNVQGQNVIKVDQTNTTEASCSKWYDVACAPQPTPVCKTLNLASNPASPIPLSQADGTIVTINPVDQLGNPLVPTTQTLWNAGTTNLEFTSPTLGTLPNPPAQQQILLPDTAPQITLDDPDTDKAPGTITVSLDPTDPAYSDTCIDTIDIVEDEFVCEDIATTITDVSSAIPVLVTEFEPGTWYKLNSTTTFTPGQPIPDDVTYTAAPGVGVFVADSLVPSPCNPTTYTDGEAVQAEPLCAASAGPITVPAGTDVYFVTFSAITTDITDALEVEATGRSEAACHESFNLTVTLDVCKSIVVNYYPTPFNPTATTTISVTPGDYGDFTGMFEFSTAPGTSGKFYLPGQELLGGNPKQFTIAEAASGVLFSGGTLGDTFTVRAVGELSGTNCNFTAAAELSCIDLEITEPSGTWTEDDFTDDDEQDFEIDVTTSPAGYASNFKYLWEVDDSTAGDWTNGSQTTGLSNTLENIDTEDLDQVDVWALEANGNRIDVCHDSIEFETPDEENPNFKKSVYDRDDEKWRETINIGGKKNNNSWLDSDHQYISYLLDFEPGSARSAEVTETAFDNGKIKSENFDGSLDYEGMIIAVAKGNKHYIAYQSTGFDEDRYNDEKFDGERLSDYDNFDEDEDYYDENYNCDSNDNDSGDICLDNDFGDLDEDFSDGKALKFDKTDNADEIFIVYQVENNTEVTDDFCKDLSAKVEGCGERFDNDAELRAYIERNFKNHESDWDEDDQARVIVICPYVLTRSGGDTFFNDEIDTGIDVSKCSPVANVPISIRSIPQVLEIPGVGQGGEEILFQTPTHDVCKLSNTGDTTLPPEYQNVFKNFSSSVCELAAEVSEKWTTDNIVTAINNNITKLARWGGVDHAVTLTNMSSVENNFSNLQSGVFVVNGDLTINGGQSGFMINKTSGFLGLGKKLPAAQTYIVRGGTLTINSNIVYNDASSDPKKPSTIPSAAFIVIDGNIKISNDVTRIDGILMAVDTDANGDGQIKSAENTAEFTNTLTVRGSLIGDVRDIFKNRRAIGDPRKDEGSITVRYDERILLNTPAGLNELINISRLKVAK